MRVKILMVCSICCLCTQMASALTEQELVTLRDGFEARRNSMLASQISNPYPSYQPGETGNLYTWNKLDFALAAFYSNVQLPAANQAVIDACTALENAIGVCDLKDYEETFHWNGNLLYRIYKFFGTGSEYNPGRLTTAAEEAIYQVFWKWTKCKSKLAHTDFSQHNTWAYWGSENHDAQQKTTSYSAAEILRNIPAYQNLLHDDGSTLAQQYDAWTAYFKEYLSQRGKKGLLVELGSYTYTKYTLQGWYNFYDFAPDMELRRLSGHLLDLWWADWSLDQINAVRGGGKNRMYQDVTQSGTNDSAYSMCWFYLNIGTPNSKHPGIMCLATSGYRMPLAVMDIALDIAGRGVYEVSSRRPGLQSFAMDADGIIGIAGDTGAILRYSYHTPAFVIGTNMLGKRAKSAWTPISSQNRWHGAIFSTHAQARIFPQCVPTSSDLKTYNQHWSVQNKGTQITQRLSTSTQTGNMRVFFSGSATNMTISEENGWVFARMSNAFAAVRPAWGTYSWDDANWIRFSDQMAPVIMEVWQSSDFSGVFSLFKAAVFDQTIDVTSGVLTYTGLKDAGTFNFYTQSSTLPNINGVAINLAPNYTFQSPYLNEDWDSGIVNIEKGERSLVLDFNYDEPITCEHLTADFTGDCVIDIDDLKELASQWLENIPYFAPNMAFVDNTSVKGLWHFDSTYTSGTDTFFADDDSVNPTRNNDLKVITTGAPYISVIDDGKFGKAVKFTASDTDVYLLTGGNWDDSWKSFALRGWVRFADAGDIGGYIAHIYDRVYLHCTLSTLTFYVTDGTNGVTITAPLDSGSDWQYIEAIYDGTTITLETQLQKTTAAGIGDISLAEQKGLYIGSRKNRNRFVGQMDEIRISTVDAIDCSDFAGVQYDLTGDCAVDNLDLSVFAQQWSE